MFWDKFSYLDIILDNSQFACYIINSTFQWFNTRLKFHFSWGAWCTFSQFIENCSISIRIANLSLKPKRHCSLNLSSANLNCQRSVNYKNIFKSIFLIRLKPLISTFPLVGAVSTIRTIGWTPPLPCRVWLIKLW